MEMRKKNTGEGLCSNACPGHGRRRRRPCSSVWDAPVSCASGKRKHGPARARAPQRSTLEEHAPRTGRSLFAAAAFAQNGHVRFQRSRENRAADDSPAAGPSWYYVRRCQNAPGAAAGRVGAAVAVSKPIFPPFSARDHFESSPRVEIAVLASSARPR